MNRISTQSQENVKSRGTTPGNRIGLLRRLARPRPMTQNQLAKIAGVSERELRRIETGEVTLKGPVLFRIARALHVGIGDLVESNEHENRAKRVLAVGVTSRRASIVCIDAKFMIIDAEPLFLRRLSSLSRKAERISKRVSSSFARLRPDLTIIEDGFGDPEHDPTARLADAVARNLGELDIHSTRLTYRRACKQIAGQVNPRACAAILSGQYDVLTERLAAAERLTICADDRLRDGRPLLAAIAMAHATVLEEFLRLG